MSKNGLFLLSIGCLILLFSANAQTASYDVLSMVTALFLIVAGGLLVFKEKKQNNKNR